MHRPLALPSHREIVPPFQFRPIVTPAARGEGNLGYLVGIAPSVRIFQVEGFPIPGGVSPTRVSLHWRGLAVEHSIASTSSHDDQVFVVFLHHWPHVCYCAVGSVFHAHTEVVVPGECFVFHQGVNLLVVVTY